MLPVVWVETARKFGKDSFLDTFLAWASLGFYGFYLNYGTEVDYQPDRTVAPKTKFGEFIGSTIYAVIIATLVHTYFMQPYIIPTGSLEKSLLVGDFLLLRKFNYGARTPQTVVSFPMVHDTIPLIKTRSYLKKPQLPYSRFPSIQQIRRNDIVVFSWPADTVRQFFKKEARVDKPVDKKSNYVKRCVALPGDTLSIIDGIIHINVKKSIMPDRAKPLYGYTAYKKEGISSRKLMGLGYKDIIRTFSISNISQNMLNSIRPYILTIVKNDRDDFRVATGHLGLPIDIVQKPTNTGKRITQQRKKFISDP